MSRFVCVWPYTFIWSQLILLRLWRQWLSWLCAQHLQHREYVDELKPHQTVAWLRWARCIKSILITPVCVCVHALVTAAESRCVVPTILSNCTTHQVCGTDGQLYCPHLTWQAVTVRSDRLAPGLFICCRWERSWGEQIAFAQRETAITALKCEQLCVYLCVQSLTSSLAMGMISCTYDENLCMDFTY